MQFLFIYFLDDFCMKTYQGLSNNFLGCGVEVAFIRPPSWALQDITMFL